MKVKNCIPFKLQKHNASWQESGLIKGWVRTVAGWTEAVWWDNGECVFERTRKLDLIEFTHADHTKISWDEFVALNLRTGEQA